MQPLLDQLNAWRLTHGRLCAVVGLAATALVHAAAGDWTHALGIALAAFGLHHEVQTPAPDAGEPTLPFRAL